MLNLKLIKADKDQRVRIEELLALIEPRIRRKFLEVIKSITNERTLIQIADLIQAGKFDEALSTVERSIARLSDEVRTAFILAGQQAAEHLSEVLEVIVGFNPLNERAVRLMRENQLRLISGFTQEQRNATRRALTLGIEQGINPKLQAKLFRESIGLTARQIEAVQNYRRLLEQGSSQALLRLLRDRRFDSTVERAVRTGVALSEEKIDRIVDRYRERYIKYRSEVIARTESLRAVHQGVEELYNQAFESGDLSPDEVVREWITAQDERVRGSHSIMHGQKKPVNEPFISGNGNRLRYPGDPAAPASEVIQCRCVVTTRLKGD